MHVRQSMVCGALIAAIACSGCLTNVTRTRKTPIYEVRRVEVGTEQVTRVQRVKTGERQLTSIERILVPQEEGATSEPVYEERSIVTTVPVYEERSIIVQIPKHEWKRFVLRVEEQQYEEAKTSWYSVVGGVLAVSVIVALSVVFLAALGPIQPT